MTLNTTRHFFSKTCVPTKIVDIQFSWWSWAWTKRTWAFAKCVPIPPLLVMANPFSITFSIILKSATNSAKATKERYTQTERYKIGRWLPRTKPITSNEITGKPFVMAGLSPFVQQEGTKTVIATRLLEAIATTKVKPGQCSNDCQ